MTDTNITQEHIDWFMELRHDKMDQEFGLFSCFLDGEPTAAIVRAYREPDGAMHIRPLFIAITPGMKLVDHDGKEARYASPSP